MDKGNTQTFMVHYCKASLKLKTSRDLLLELSQDIGNVGRGGQTNHDVKLLQFHVDGIVVLDKEHFDVFFQNLWPEVGN